MLFRSDADALRATGFLVRNFKMLSREQWMEDTIKHTAQAFLGVTMGCAKCHDHMTEAISQADYYRMRAIFDPHNVRTDKISGQLDTAKDGIVRAFDKSPEERTYLLVRGDERHPDTNRVMEAGVPVALCGTTALAKVGGKFDLAPVKLPTFAAQPDSREFVIKDTIAASERTLADAREALEKLKTNAAPDADKLKELQLSLAATQAKHDALLAVIAVERVELDGKKDSENWKRTATAANAAQRTQTVAEAQLKLHQARVALGAAVRREAEEKADGKSAADKKPAAVPKKKGEIGRAHV